MNGTARQILIWPHPSLTVPAAAVTTVDDAIRSLAADLQVTMQAANGVGLAAPQIGVLQRVLVLNAGQGCEVYINPSLTGIGRRSQKIEGCLSIPGFYERVWRFEKVQCKWLGLDGKDYESEFDGARAHILQHESEHLDGILMVQHLPAGRRSQIRGELQKRRR